VFFVLSIDKNNQTVRKKKIMLTIPRLKNLFLRQPPEAVIDPILPVKVQIKAWHKANRIMGWNIPEDEFEKQRTLSSSNGTCVYAGFIGTALFYGFGDDGSGNSDAVLSGALAWEYGRKRRRDKIWQCEYIDFEKPDDIRLRPGAPLRPKGFYYARLQPGKHLVNLTVSQLRKRLGDVTGWGPEGFQFLTITHTHFADLMTERKIPFMALADYDVAPHGFNDFYDAPQIFCSNHILGLGIGNVDRNYPLFGIPTLQICKEAEQ
jgi:hypothetical protein